MVWRWLLTESWRSILKYEKIRIMELQRKYVIQHVSEIFIVIAYWLLIPTSFTNCRYAKWRLHVIRESDFFPCQRRNGNVTEDGPVWMGFTHLEVIHALSSFQELQRCLVLTMHSQKLQAITVIYIHGQKANEFSTDFGKI